MIIQTFIRTDQPTKSGNLPVIFRINGVKINTGESVVPDVWDQDKQMIGTRFTKYAIINKKISKKKNALQAIIDANPGADPKTIRDLFNKYLENPAKLDEILSNKETGTQTATFSVLVDTILHEHRNSWSEKYMTKFKTVRSKLLDFDPNFTLDKFTVAYWRKFVDHCVEEWENENNTISVDTKNLCRLMEIIRSKGHHVPANLDEIKKPYREPEIMSLEWDQVKAIADLDLSEPLRPTMPTSRLLWLIGAYTGRRWSEVIRMTPESFYKDQDKRWRYKGIGKGKKPFDIPLLPEAIELLKKIKFTLPDLLAPQTVNLDIKDIARAAKITQTVDVNRFIGNETQTEKVNECDTVHFHTGRHSYCMRIVDLAAGKPHAEKWISHMMGHASMETTWKYMNRRASSHDQMFDEIIGKPE